MCSVDTMALSLHMDKPPLGRPTPWRESCMILTRWASFHALLRIFSITSLLWMKTWNSTSRFPTLKSTWTKSVTFWM
ncbi:hypothetical protein ATANTOWER_008292, partial [Ataeniobius toweri]|nr:hypothetical protein [Ataeniobius toweri]